MVSKRVAALLAVMAACSRAEQADERPLADTGAQRECSAVEGQLSASLDVGSLAGEYELVMVATSGARSGEHAIGTLQLQPQAEDLRQISVAGQVDPQTSMPLYGHSDLDLAAVGALDLGGVSSDEAQRPGIAVVMRQGDPPSITLRLGADANRRDVQRFDGGYTALRVTSVEDGNLFGSWASGVTSDESSGYFCAWRQ